MFPDTGERDITETEYTEQATVLRHLDLPDLIERAAMLERAAEIRINR
jgi:hypothetical protein